MSYAYQEYPKAVLNKDGYEVIVKDAEEEAKTTGKAQAAIQKQAESNIEAGQAADLERDQRDLDRLREKGSDVSEDEAAKLTDLAAKIEVAKRGPGRPKKASE